MRMKFFPLLMLGFGGVFLALGSSLFLWIYDQQYIKALANLENFQTRTHRKINDHKFIESHQKEIAFLQKKKWFSRKNRLVAAEKIKNLRGNIDLINIIFEPEYYDTLDSDYTFNKNKIKIEFKSLDENDIYAFIDKLNQDFPGIYIINEFKESYQEGCFHGHLILDWFSFDEENTDS